jgi:hypothetical protein
MSFSIVDTIVQLKNKLKHFHQLKKHVPRDYDKLHLFYSSMFTLSPTIIEER